MLTQCKLNVVSTEEHKIMLTLLWRVLYMKYLVISDFICTSAKHQLVSEVGLHGYMK